MHHGMNGQLGRKAEIGYLAVLVCREVSLIGIAPWAAGVWLVDGFGVIKVTAKYTVNPPITAYNIGKRNLFVFIRK